MVNLQKSGDRAVKFVFTDSDHYLYGNGEIEVPVNSLLLVIDESDMVTFKKLSGDPFLSFRADNSNLGTKAAIEQFYKENMVGSTGGGSESGITSGEVQTMIDNSLEDYYTDDEVDAALSGKASVSDVTAVNDALTAHTANTTVHVTQNEKNTWNGKVDEGYVSDYAYSKNQIDGFLSNAEQVIATKADTSALTAVNGALTTHTADTTVHVSQAEKATWNAKADASAITSIESSITAVSNDLNTLSGAVIDNEYTVSQAINELKSTKQDTLASGTNIKTINNESILGSGNIDIQGGGSNINVVQTTGTSTTDVMSQDAVTNAFNTYTARRDEDEGIVRYWNWITPDYPYGNNVLYNFSINGKLPLSKQTKATDYSNIFNFHLVETSAITSAITSASTNAEVAGAKAVYDAIQAGGGGITVDPTLDTGSTNPVANSAITQALENKLDASAYTPTDLSEYWTSAQTQSAIDGVNNVLTAHTANTTVHVTQAEKDAWNAKVDSSAITTAITSGSTDSEIPTAKATYDAIQAGGGGGATYSAGTNISIDTGNTISCTLNLRNGTGQNSITGVQGVAKGSENFAIGSATTAGTNGADSHAFAIGYNCKARKSRTFAFGATVDIKEIDSVAFGQNITLNAPRSFSTGYHNTTNNWTNIALGEELTTNNRPEFATGTYNNSVTGSTDADKTLFSVGNGTSSARHNAFEIRQNGDIYVNDGTNDVRLQDTILALGGLKFVKLTQAEYSAMEQAGTLDANTLYIVTNVVS